LGLKIFFCENITQEALAHNPGRIDNYTPGTWLFLYTLCMAQSKQKPGRNCHQASPVYICNAFNRRD